MVKLIVENKEEVPVGIRTTTLKEIEDKDNSEKRYHDAVLFGIDDPLEDRSQHYRKSNIPDRVPFMFGIGGGLHVLYDLRESKPVWKTIQWQGDPEWPCEVGEIYFRDRGYKYYAKIAENEKGGWVWQEMNPIEEEKASFKTGKKEWEYKIYFGPEYRKSAGINNQLNERGWAVIGVSENEDFVIPEELESQGLEPNYIDGVRFPNYLIVDPDRAEMKRVKWNQRKDLDEDKLKEQGWEFVDSNIVRTVYARTKNS
jgi:hypothetical protein